MQQLGIAGLDLCYSHLRTRQGNPVDDALDAAISLTDHVGPEVRLAAVQVLSASAKELSSRAAQQMTPKDQSRIDLVFQKLCSVVTMDTVPAVRLEALAGLSDMPYASLAVRRQALSKRATYTGATADASATDSSLLDSATGAFVHGSEDDVEKVRLATITAMCALGNNDKQFADEAAIILISSVSDELLEVRKAALTVLLQWATEFRQQYLQLQQQKALCKQQEQQAVQHSQQQQQQQHQAAGLDPSPGDAQEGDQTDEEGEWTQQQQQQEDSTAAAVDTANAPAAHNASMTAAAGTAVAKPQRAGRKLSKKRRGDSPPWGPDALAAAVAALRDSNAEVRQLALQLAQLLPPNGVQAVLGLVQGLVDCCERFRCQHLDTALQIAEALGQQRAVYVGMVANKLVKLMCKDASVAGAATITSAFTQIQTYDPYSRTSNNSRDWQSAHCSPGLQILQKALLTAAAVRPQVAQSALQQLASEGPHQQQQLGSLVQRLTALRQQQQQFLQQG